MSKIDRIILHVDVNNAFLSWMAVDLLNSGSKEDIREEISVIGGDEKSRSGVVLAKSVKAKEIGIKTGDTIYEARSKCPQLIIKETDKCCYEKYSQGLIKILMEYSDKVEKYSIDECFVDITYCLMGRSVDDITKEIQVRIKKELGFTVNIGISDCKVLAKMASDFTKPNKIHTLYKDEIPYKMWSLPVSELFMVGKRSLPKLLNMQIITIGDLANRSREDIMCLFGKHGKMIWEYANGIDVSDVIENREKNKSISKEVTLDKDITDIDELEKRMYALVESVTVLLRESKMSAKTVSVHLRSFNFADTLRQRKLEYSTCSTKEIYELAKKILKDMHDIRIPVRLIGVRVDDLEEAKSQEQLSLFDDVKNQKQSHIDEVMDKIKEKYGEKIITRAKRI